MSGPRLRGELRPPGDKSVTHRALLLGGLAQGRTTVHGPLDAADTRASAAAVEALGATVAWQDGVLTVDGCPAPGRPGAALDCGNSGTTARLLTGLLAPRPGRWLLDGDASLRRRPMGRVVTPLASLGATIAAAGEASPTSAVPADAAPAHAAPADAAPAHAAPAHGADQRPSPSPVTGDPPPPGAGQGSADGDRLRLPLRIDGASLRGGDVHVAVPSAQVKSALMLAGLAARAPLTVHQSTPTRDHTERLLPRFGAEVQVDPGAVTVSPGPLAGTSVQVPGDPSSAAFAVVAALLLPGSRLTLRGVGLWPRRGGFLLALQQADAPVEVLSLRDQDGDPLADLHVESGAYEAFTIQARDVPDLVDELPILALAASRAQGTSRLLGLGELRVKESDRLAGLVALLGDLGVPVEQQGDGLTITGVSSFRAAPERFVDHPDHRLAMTAALATLVTTGQLPAPPAAAVSWPGFAADLAACLES